jgi:hypothetical protein
MVWQVLSPAADARGPMDVIPPDEDPDADVLDALDTPASPIDEPIDRALQEPHAPGGPRERVAGLAGVGQAVMRIVARAVDDAGGLRMACQEVRR